MKCGHYAIIWGIKTNFTLRQVQGNLLSYLKSIKIGWHRQAEVQTGGNYGYSSSHQHDLKGSHSFGVVIPDCELYWTRIHTSTQTIEWALLTDPILAKRGQGLSSQCMAKANTVIHNGVTVCYIVIIILCTVITIYTTNWH